MSMMPIGTIKTAGLSTAEICNAWNLPPILSTTAPSTGTIHQITILSTTEAKYVLRAYRYAPKDRARIVTEHAVSSYVQVHGLPAIAPLPLPSGETILEHEGRFYAIYPFARGQQIPREQVTSHDIIAAMGHCLGALHQLLAAYPPEQVRSQSWSVDPSTTFSKMERIEAVIAEKASSEPFDQQILAMLAQRKAWLTTTPPVDLQPFTSLPRQVLHGDYQETNLFFTDGKVSAIIDWDQAYIAPRTWELIRTLHYVLNLDALRCHTFLKAYREVFPLSFEELDTTAKAYGWIQAHNLWAYTSFYLDNNQRVRHLLQSSFTPFAESWAAIADLL